MTKTTLQILLDRFNAEYEKLYDAGSSGTAEDLEFFDAIASIDPATVGQFVQLRQDFISSDREAAAFAIAFRACRAEALGY